MKIYREVGSLYIVNRKDAEGYERPIYEIEVDEVVECKECKHYGTSLKGIPTQGYCKLTEWQTRHDNDYCSMGEKTDGRREV